MDAEERLRSIYNLKRAPKTDEDIIAVNRAWFDANPDPAFAAELRANIRNPAYVARIKHALNVSRRRRGRPPISGKEWDRLVWLMTNSVR